MPNKDQEDFTTGYMIDVAKNRIGGSVGRLRFRINEGTQALDAMPDPQRAVFDRLVK